MSSPEDSSVITTDARVTGAALGENPASTASSAPSALGSALGNVESSVAWLPAPSASGVGNPGSLPSGFTTVEDVLLADAAGVADAVHVLLPDADGTADGGDDVEVEFALDEFVFDVGDAIPLGEDVDDGDDDDEGDGLAASAADSGCSGCDDGGGLALAIAYSPSCASSEEPALLPLEPALLPLEPSSCAGAFIV